MKRFLHTVAAALVRLWNTRDVLQLRNIRLEKLQYTLAMPLCLGVANMMSSLFRGNAPLLGLDPKVTLYCAYLIGAFLFFFVPAGGFFRFSRAFCAMAGTAFAVWLVLPAGGAQSVGAAVCWFALGGCTFCATYAYMLVINNTERFFGALVVAVNYGICLLLDAAGVAQGSNWRVLPALFLYGSIICITQFGEEELAESFAKSAQKPDKTMYPAFALFLIFFLMDAFISVLCARGGRAAILFFGAGATLGGVVYAVVQLVFKRSIWNVWNLYFILLTISFALMQTAPRSPAYRAGAFLCGLCTIGYAAAFYTFGGVMKKFGSLAVFKKLMCCACLPTLTAAFAAMGLLQAHLPELIPTISIAAASACFILYVLFSPLFQKHLFAADWSEDYSKPDMTAISVQIAQTDRLGGCGLTPREREVCALLLLGCSRKQIGLKLRISHATVGFHCTSLYKKLKISSLPELFAMLGVKEVAPQRESGKGSAGGTDAC